MIRIHLSRLLGEKKWSQQQLVKATGIRANTISDMYHEMIERVSIDHLDKICQALECHLYDLLEYIPTKKKRTPKKDVPNSPKRG